MRSSLRDRGGVGGAFLVGVAVGLALSAPMLPAAPAGGLAPVSVGPIGGYLLAGVLAVLVIPLCTALLYVVLAQTDK